MRQLFRRLSLCLALASVTSTVAAYDIVERATLVDDRFKTLEMTRPIGHDFYFNVAGYISPETLDLKDDADKAGKVDTGDTATDITEINKILEKYYDKEQIVRANVGFGFPLPSFSAFDAAIKPNFRVDAGLFAMLTPEQDKISLAKLINNLDQIDPALQSQLSSCLADASDGSNPQASNGDDLIVFCVDNGYATQAEADLLKDTYGIDSIPYNSTYANTSVDGAAVDIYAKAEIKAGFFNTYTHGDHFFGDFNLYALGRIDIKKRADAILLLGGGGGFDYAENGLVNIVTDYMFGYKNSNYKVKAGIEEMKIAEMSKSDKGTLNFGDSALFRVHGQADYRLSFFKLSPYAGFHTRSGYGLGDSYYLGADWGMYAWEDRLGLNLKTQMDKEHITLGFRAKIWFMHADLTGKFPITAEMDGIKVSTYYGGNIRFFF
ncbi:MAG: hypothetical protein BM556_16900 [Bacteriovorax sp. MedPE-SWde]|nr:MAG: hypothetical protein BM556_16900 [Bacteriovorax sp. MedPE-SWde]